MVVVQRSVLISNIPLSGQYVVKNVFVVSNYEIWWHTDGIVNNAAAKYGNDMAAKYGNHMATKYGNHIATKYGNHIY